MKIKVVTCAIRNRDKGKGNVPNLEIGNDVANALTSFEKDSMVMIFRT